MNANWLKLLPAPLRDRLDNRPRLQQALSNTGWLFGDRLLRMAFGLVIGIWIARYLGPEQFGTLNYVLAVVGLFGAVAGMGLNGIVVRDLIRQPESAPLTLGSGFAMQLASGMLACIGAVATIVFLRPDDTLARLLAAVLGFTLVFKASDIARYWFESQVQSRYTVWSDNSAFLLLAGVRVVLLLTGAPLIAFAWAILAETVVGAVLLFVFYRHHRTGDRWRVSRARLGTLFRDSWPLVLSGLAVMVYMRIDQIMLGWMLDDTAVGVYSAAVRLSEVWYFVPTALIASIMPAIITIKSHSPERYSFRLQRLFDLFLIASLVVATGMSFLSETLIVRLFGPAYVEAGTVLAIHIWASVFVCTGLVSGQWLIVENLQRAILMRTLLGAVINVLGNLLLIPEYGIAGAAIATVVSYGVSVYSVALDPKARPVVKMMLGAFKFPSLYKAT